MEVFSRGSGPSIIRCLTYSVPEAAFLRIMHLPDGNYILIGPEQFSDIGVSRRRDNELWFLSKELGSKPIKARPEDERRRGHFEEKYENGLL